jgi:putative ABC transport system permease protein
MTLFNQVRAVTVLNLRALPRRLRPSLVMVIGVAGAVAATLSLVALDAGLRSMAFANTDPNLVVVFSAGAAGEPTSTLSPAQVGLIEQTPGIRRNAAGQVVAQAESLITIDVVRKNGGVTDRRGLRGVGPIGLAMDKHFHLIAGRMFRPGIDELIVGKKAAEEYSGLSLGSHIALRGVEWTAVGEYEDGGGFGETELMTDAHTEIIALGRHFYQCVIAELDHPSDFARFRDALAANPQLSVVARPYAEFMATEVRRLTEVLDFVAYLVGTVMAAGAVFAALNTLYSAVDARRREIATLRAIGYGGFAVLTSVIGEALALAVPGAILGVLLTWFIVDGRRVDVSGSAYNLAVTPGAFVFGLACALAVALFGALLPGLKAARMPIVEALRG